MVSQQASTSSTKVSSEDIISQKTDLCIGNAVVKTGIGFSAGVLLSVLLFRRRAFPVWLGTGFGLGSAYTDCQRSFNPVAVPGVRVVPSSSSANISATSLAPQTTLEKIRQKAGEAFSAAKDEAQDKGTSVVEKAEQKGLQALDSAKAQAHKIEEKVRRLSARKVCRPRILPAPSSRVVFGRKRRVSSSGSIALVRENDCYLVRSTLESWPAASANARLPGSDCLACRLTGFAAMSGLGAYSFVEAYRMGILRRSPLPAGVKARPLWAATLVVFGVGCMGAGVVRLGI
ncbi:hypothetical protein NDA18_004548 [Ustilago nuda]|nr:hypothetical protein NDA18_004548 [Ustilago nuda]